MAVAVVEALDLPVVTTFVAGVEPASLADDEVAKLVVDTERLLNAVHALSAAALEEFQRRGTWADDGALSAAGWAAARSGSPTRVLRDRVRAGAGLRLLPTATPAARSGRLSPQHLATLGGCARRHPCLAARDETVLVEQAEVLDADTFAAAIRHWEACADALDAPDPALASDTELGDKLHLSRTFDGRYRLDGTFSAENGELLRVALDGEVDRHLRAGRDGDPSVAPAASQVRAGALIDLVARTMRREPSEQSVPDRYRVAVVVRADQRDDLPLAACDSPAYRVVLGARGEVLDVGRLTQIWPAGIRRAITLRDGGCVFPACGRPPSWCDVHHCQPWNNGGGTSVDNGALLCRKHHTFIHKSRWFVDLDEGTPIIRKPDGSRHTITKWNRRRR